MAKKFINGKKRKKMLAKAFLIETRKNTKAAKAKSERKMKNDSLENVNPE